MLGPAAAGDLTFNPEKDTLVGADGKEILLKSPFGDELPEKGFDAGAAPPPPTPAVVLPSALNATPAGMKRRLSDPARGRGGCGSAGAGH